MFCIYSSSDNKIENMYENIYFYFFEKNRLENIFRILWGVIFEGSYI